MKPGQKTLENSALVKKRVGWVGSVGSLHQALLRAGRGAG